MAIIPMLLQVTLFLALFMSTLGRRPSLEGHEIVNVELSEAMTFFTKYGYMNTIANFSGLGPPIESADDPRITKAVHMMQEFFHLPETGQLDRRTVDMMRQPRCGCRDILPGGGVQNVAMENGPLEYNLAGRRFRWHKTDLSYTYLSYPTGDDALQPEEVRKIIQRAFGLWSDVTPLTFDEVANSSQQQADIRIKFGSGHHHPDEPTVTSFDGMGGELAHAFAPNSFWGDLEGDIHFDDDELFTAAGKRGYLLLLVAAHEIGHSLGLAHSNDPGSLMWPNYKYVPIKGYKVPSDDVQGIQAIYGSRPKPVGPVQVPTRRIAPEVDGVMKRPDSLSVMCRKPFSALLKMDSELFAFRDKLVWRIRIRDRKLISPPKGEPVKRLWKKFPMRITAAYQREDGNTVFFKGDKYYVYRGKKRQGSPKRITTMGVSRPPMAALRAMHVAPHKVYLIRGAKVWLYDESTGSVDSGYPQPVNQVWRDLPAGVTGGAMLDDESALFLKGNRYFMVDANNRVMSRREGDMGLFSVDFLGCSFQTWN